VLDFTLPAINDVDLETLIDSRISSLVRQHSSSATGHGHGLDPSSGGTATGGGTGGVRGRIAVEFYEKKRRRSGMWFPGLAGKGEEEICWEVWNLEVTIATPRTESGMSFLCSSMALILRGAQLLTASFVQSAQKFAGQWRTCYRKLR
jgi:hypothetical protein